MSIEPSPAHPSTGLHIESRWLSEAVFRIAVSGEIDLATTDELQAALFSAISSNPAPGIEVDLAGISFMDCGGLSVLLLARQAATRAGCRLRIIRPQPTVRHVLEITGLLDALTLYPTDQTLRRGDLGRYWEAGRGVATVSLSKSSVMTNRRSRSPTNSHRR